MEYKFTTFWFCRSQIRMKLRNFLDPNQELHILEIGSFEGRSSCWFSDNFLNHEMSTLTCVDPFNTSDRTTKVDVCTKDLFIHNLSLSKNSSKCHLESVTSHTFFEKLNVYKYYDLIYIDGSHEISDVYQDMVNSWKVLKSGGLMWMDDYGYSPELTQIMNQFKDEHQSELDVIITGYQLAFRKR